VIIQIGSGLIAPSLYPKRKTKA